MEYVRTRRRGGGTRRKLIHKGGPSVAVIKKVRVGAPTAARRTLTRQTAARVTTYRKKKNALARQAPLPAKGGPGTFSMFSAYQRPSARVRAMKKVGAANYDVSNLSDQIVIKEGEQGCDQYSFQNLDDLKKLMTNIGPTGLSVPPRQFVLESMTGEFLITNSTILSQYVDIYDIVRKRDASANAVTTAPVNAWLAGVLDESQGVETAGQTLINSLPTDSRLFKDYFRVVKRTHLCLTGGATHRHMIRLKANKLIDSSLLDRADADLAGLTVYTMIVAYGQPASIRSDAGAIVTTASGALDIVLSKRFKYTWVDDNQNHFYRTDNLSTLTGEVGVSQYAVVPNQFV